MYPNDGRTTVFMTAEECEHLRNAVKDRLQRCQKLSGQLRVRIDPKTALSQVTAASLLSDIATAPEPGMATKSRPESIVAFAVGFAYAPCTAPLRDLQPMKLSDLRLETHHHGRVLAVRREAPVVELNASSWTVVQERFSGEVQRLEMTLHKSANDEDILESGCIFMVKEPYFTLGDSGDPTIRIDHPSDIVVCTDDPGNDSLFPFSIAFDESDGAIPATTPAVFAAKTARDCKNEGNTALKRQALPCAHENYSEGLRLAAMDPATGKTLACDIFRNRAYVNLLLNRLDEAKADALASITGIEDQKNNDLDSKAYFRAGRAAYKLGEFQEAKSYFQKQQKLTPADKDAIASLRKIEMRLHEQATGNYDFGRFKAGLSKARPCVDAASFTRHTEVRESPGRGRGLFATCNIVSGNIIMCEKAFCVAWGHGEEAWTAMTYDIRDDTIRAFPAGLCKAIVHQLSNNPSQVETVMDLYGDYEGIGKHLIMRDGRPVIDTFQVRDIVARNAFSPGAQYGDEDVRHASTGLWIRASYINHSCLANAKAEYLGDVMILRATRPISAGEEITHRYFESSDYDERCAALMTTWGFKCTCALCAAEEVDGPDLRKRRRGLEHEANALVEREGGAKAKRLTVRRAERLARSITDTYDDERYQDVPRTALSRICEWLTEARSTRSV